MSKKSISILALSLLTVAAFFIYADLSTQNSSEARPTSSAAAIHGAPQNLTHALASLVPAASAASQRKINLKQAAFEIERDARFAAFGRSSSHVLSASASDLINGERLSTVRFRHAYKGLPVIGSEVLYHQGAAGQVWIESAAAEFDLSTRPSVSVASAVAVVRSQLGRFDLVSKPSLEILPNRIDGTETQDSARLVYRAHGLGKNEPIEAFVDAQSGELISAISRHITIAPITIYNAEGQGIDFDNEEFENEFGGDAEAYLAAHKNDCQVLYAYETPEFSGKDPLVINADACELAYSSKTGSTEWLDESSRRAVANTQRTLQYYLAAHGRDSFDDRGGEAVSIVNAGVNFANAFWNSADKIMAYGGGDGVTMNDLTLAVDVAGHEMTHGVVSETAQLQYGGESGALNEAVADYFGKMIEGGGTWVMGEGLFLDGTAGIRDLERPANLRYRNQSGQIKPYPSHYKDREVAVGACSGENDNCWVHINSTIFSHGLYRIHEVIGEEAAQELVYQTLTQELTATSNLLTAGKSVRRACAKAFQASVCQAVDAELRAVGI